MDYNQYSIFHSSPVPDYLVQLERETQMKMAKPNMLTGPIQGRFLSFISKMIQPNAILEVGTFTGYGCLCLAEGLKKEGKLTTLEVNEENAWLAKKYIALSPFSEQIDLILGPALDFIQTTTNTWDLIYIDADKQNNLQYFKTIWPKVKPGGLVMVDNVFGRGAIWKNEDEQKPFEKAIVEFNEWVSKITDGIVLMLPIRDGISCILKNNLTDLPVNKKN